MKRVRKAMTKRCGGRLFTAERRIQEANGHADPAACLTADQKSFTSSKAREITLECFRVTSLLEKEPHIVEWMFTLVEQNMKELYDSCAWGWNAKAKVSLFVEFYEYLKVVNQSINQLRKMQSINQSINPLTNRETAN